MIQIILNKSGAGKIVTVVTINEDATPGTWGSHQFLLEEYKRLDEDWIEGDDKNPTGAFKQLQFNTQFLEYIQAKYGELHCEYCGKPHLKIYSWKQKAGADVATTDHFHAKADNKHLAFNRQNLLVACHTCNNNKGRKHGKVENIKYYYPESKIWIYDQPSLWNPGNNPVSLP